MKYKVIKAFPGVSVGDLVNTDDFPEADKQSEWFQKVESATTNDIWGAISLKHDHKSIWVGLVVLLSFVGALYVLTMSNMNLTNEVRALRVQLIEKNMVSPIQ